MERVELLTRQILSVELDADYVGASGAARRAGVDRASPVRSPPLPAQGVAVAPPAGLRRPRPAPLPRRWAGVPDVIHGHYADAGAVAARARQLLDSGAGLHRALARSGQAGAPARAGGRTPRRSRSATTSLAGSGRGERDPAGRPGRGQHPAGGRGAVRDVLRAIRSRDGRDPARRAASIGSVHRAPESRRPAVAAEIDRFLTQPDRPMILAMQRPDERKNLATLIDAFAGAASLRERANLVLMIGTRDDIAELQRASAGSWRRCSAADRPLRPLRLGRLPEAARSRTRSRSSTGWPLGDAACSSTRR